MTTYTGLLEVTVSQKGERSILSSCYFEGAFKIARPVYLEDHQLALYWLHVGGGYVDGDHFLTKISVNSGSEALVTTPSFTKVYRTPISPVQQKVVLTLQKNSALEFLPDPLIAYEGARFLQEIEIYMEEGASLIYWDILTPGWSEEGVPFRYEWIRSKCRLYKSEKLVLFDHLFLKPVDDLKSPIEMGEYTHLGTLIIVHDSVTQKVKEALDTYLVDEVSGVRFGLSFLPEGILLVRAMGNSTRDIEGFLTKVYQWTKTFLGKRVVVVRK